LLAPILEDLLEAKTGAADAAALELDFARLYVVMQAVVCAVSVGQWSTDWLLCAISDRIWEAQGQGASTETGNHPERLIAIFDQRGLVQIGARQVVLTWLSPVFYE
jgi:hypothetical protein